MHSDKQRRDRLQATRERARVSPIRARILDLLEKNGDTQSAIDPKQLLKRLNGEIWPPATLSQVNYHLRWLAGAELIPAPCRGG